MSTTPERTLPENIEAAMREVTAAAFDLQDIMGRELVDELPRVMDRLKQAEGRLRQAILVALEPDQALWQELELLNKVEAAANRLAGYYDEDRRQAVIEAIRTLYAFRSTQLTATSSAHEGRE